MQTNVTWTEYRLRTICWNLKVTNTTAHLHTMHGTPLSCYDWNPRFHWTRCLASEFTRPQSSWLKDLRADTRTHLSDSNSGHRWSEAAPYLCLGSAEAKHRWKSHWTVAAMAESLHLRKGTTLWTAAKLNIAFSCLTLRFRIFCSVTTARCI